MLFSDYLMSSGENLYFSLPMVRKSKVIIVYFAKIKYFILNEIKIVNSSIREVITVLFYLKDLPSTTIKFPNIITKVPFLIYPENTSESSLAIATQ